MALLENDFCPHSVLNGNLAWSRILLGLFHLALKLLSPGSLSTKVVGGREGGSICCFFVTLCKQFDFSQSPLLRFLSSVFCSSAARFANVVLIFCGILRVDD